ncbi:MAG: hypothetical protein OEZ37_02165 [Gemmatimonadota bacterium]|nr:hypothetical protein [Gemmatimonadota bacterium]
MSTTDPFHGRGRVATVPLLLAAAVLTACASSGSERPPRAAPVRSVVSVGGMGRAEMHTEAGVGQRTYGVAARQVWPHLSIVFERLEIPVETLDERAMEIGNLGYGARRVEGKWMSTYIDCGTNLTGILANNHDITLTVIARLEARPDGTSVLTTLVDAWGKPRATSGNPIHCQSKGVLEERVAELVAQRLAGIGG